MPAAVQRPQPRCVHAGDCKQENERPYISKVTAYIFFQGGRICCPHLRGLHIKETRTLGAPCVPYCLNNQMQVTTSKLDWQSAKIKLIFLQLKNSWVQVWLIRVRQLGHLCLYDLNYSTRLGILISKPYLPSVVTPPTNYNRGITWRLWPNYRLYGNR